MLGCTAEDREKLGLVSRGYFSWRGGSDPNDAPLAPGRLSEMFEEFLLKEAGGSPVARREADEAAPAT